MVSGGDAAAAAQQCERVQADGLLELLHIADTARGMWGQRLHCVPGITGEMLRTGN